MQNITPQNHKWTLEADISEMNEEKKPRSKSFKYFNFNTAVWIRIRRISD